MAWYFYIAFILAAFSVSDPMPTLRECSGVRDQGNVIRHVVLAEMKHQGRTWLRVCADGKSWSKYDWTQTRDKWRRMYFRDGLGRSRDGQTVNFAYMMLVDRHAAPIVIEPRPAQEEN